MTENQKYGGSNYVQKEFKGEKKQDEWLTVVEQAIQETNKDSIKNILKKIVDLGNVPRKKKKFEVSITYRL